MVQKIPLIKEITEKLKELLPKNCEISKVELEGPELVLYTKNPECFFGQNLTENIVSKIAFELKKKVNIRCDKSLLSSMEQAKKEILEIVPEDAEVKEIYFNEPFCEVVIEAIKKGIVIGKGGEVSKQIILKTGWTPKILRAPTSPSETLTGIRRYLHKHISDRKKFLLSAGEKIFSEPATSTHKWVTATALGGFREVGRSSILVTSEQTKVLLDTGLSFSTEDPYPYLDFLGYPLSELDGIVVTHAHTDHSGLLPYIYKLGYDGPVYSTLPTRDLMTLLQFDYINVNLMNENEAPYNERDVKNAVLHSIPREYREVTDIAPDMRLTLHNAAHILGSSSAHLNIGEGRHNLVYSSDIKYGFTRLFNNIDIRYPRLETLLIESTYGSHDAKQLPRDVAEKKLLDLIKETTEFGGNVLIPVFGVGRGQEISLVIENMYRNGLLTEDNRVYVDGMVREASAIHTAYPEYLRSSLKKRILTNNSPFDSPVFQEAKRTERDKIVSGKGAIILATGGMMQGGPVIDYFHKMAENQANTLLFVGYLAEGSLGRKLQQGMRSLPISNNGRTRKLDVKMRIEMVDGFSGHSDFNQLNSYFSSLKPKPKRVLVGHGDPVRSIEFSKNLAARFRVNSTSIRNLDTVRLR